MSDSRPRSGPSPDGADEEVEGGILGNLPRSRPGVRSPRRAEQGPASAEAGVERAEQGGSGQAQRPGSEVEAVARAGLSLAGGAAALGLKMASRAMAAARDAVERR